MTEIVEMETNLFEVTISSNNSPHSRSLPSPLQSSTGTQNKSITTHLIVAGGLDEALVQRKPKP
jgi:hypothetical protein